MGIAQVGATAALFALMCILMVQPKRSETIQVLVHMLARVTAAAGVFIVIAYLMEFAIAYYDPNPYEYEALRFRQTSSFAWRYWLPFFGSGVLSQVLWFPKTRTSVALLGGFSSVMLVAALVPLCTSNPTNSCCTEKTTTKKMWQLLARRLSRVGKKRPVP